MADLSDICAYLKSAAAAAVYPNGFGNPSIVQRAPGFPISGSMDVRIFEGWPIPDQLDLDMAGSMMSGSPAVKVPRPNGPAANVSIYPQQGGTVTPFQVQDHTYVCVPPNLGMSVASIVGNVITIAGQPNASEYLTIIADRQHVYSSGGAATTAVLAALATAAASDYAGVSSTATTLTIPYGYQIEARIGGVATLGIATHRQRHSIMVTTWAPTHTARSVIAGAIDNMLKRTITAAMPDSSIARFVYSRSNQTDEQQLQTVYRRDLVYDVDYATVWQFPGYVVTAPIVQVAGGNWGLQPPQPSPPIINAVGY